MSAARNLDVLQAKGASMSQAVEYGLLVEIRLPVSVSVLGVIGEAICKAYPGSVMRQQGEHLLFEVPIEKSSDENI
jgi:hypothetical protein